MNRATEGAIAWARKRKKALKPKSNKRRKFYAETYLPFRRQYLETHGRCEIAAEGCTGKSIDLHHIRSRGRSGRDADLAATANVKATCRGCHDYVESHREWAVEQGFLKPARTDEERRSN